MTEILEIFSLFLNTDKFQKCQTHNKKSSKSFSDLLLLLAAGGGWYSVLKFGGRLAREIRICHSVQLHGKWKVVLEF